MNRETEGLSVLPLYVRRHGRKLTVLFLWLALFAGYQLYAWRQDLTPPETLWSLTGFLTSSMAGAPVFLGLYIAGPLLLFPVGLLAATAGFVFGPVKGILLTLLGTTFSSSFAYLVGRYFGKDLPGSENTGLVGRCAERMRTNGFESVLIARFTFLPFDLINYTAGLLRIGWKPFILGSTLGSLPAMVSFVLLGASVGIDSAEGTMTLDPLVLAASGVLLVGSLMTARYLKRRERKHVPEV